MPRVNQLTVTTGNIRREYHLVHEDDSPERSDAVKFFQEHADRLFPSMNYPEEVGHMPIEKANAYLREHPFLEQWSLLRIGRENPICDDDLARLRHLPELDHVQISSDRITDAGIEHLVHLPALTRLGVYSAGVTDACLRVIRTLRSLQSLDIQAAPNVSRAAVLDAVDAMPWLQDATEEIARASSATRIVRFDREPMSHLPAEVFAIDDIGHLSAINCGIEVLPEAIGNLTQLRVLYLNWCRLLQLPSAIGRLTALEELWLNNNHLSSLPDSFRGLVRLKKLCLDANSLARFPKTILELKQLEELRFTDNGLAALPEEIGDIAGLRSLSLGRNNLTTLPRSIAKLEKLTYLGLQGNPLVSLPAELWRLPCLVTLNLGNTGFVDLPPEAANIPNIIGLPGQRIHS